MWASFYAANFLLFFYARVKRPHEGRRRAGKLTREKKEMSSEKRELCMGDYR
jgi:hypothetical protein